MKKITFISSQKSKLVLLTGLLVFVSSFNIYSQTFRFEPTQDNPNSTGALFKVGTSNNLVGLWVNAPNGQSQWGTSPFTPQSNFHIFSNSSSLTNTPLFTASVFDGIKISGLVSNLFINPNNGLSYGIFQSGPSLMSNYFACKVGIGTLTPNSAFMLDVNGKIGLSSTIEFHGNGGILFYSQGFPITYQVSPSGYITHPLTIFQSRVQVLDTLECNNFLLHLNAGNNKVLVSDNIGNGKWTDASGFLNGFWKLSDDKKNICLNENYGKVGIGTSNPMQKLHVVNGNILISRQEGQTKNFGSLNGSILFGEIASDKLPNGEWGIEYYNPDPKDDFSTGGLNFWKVGNDDHQGSNYNLFLRNDGNVGIGTSTPQSTLAVNGKVTAKEFEATLNGWPDYVFDNTYNLRPLKDLENYIQVNKHLPEIPAAKEVKEQGVRLGEMNALLVKKVEELTLYIISMQKEIEELKADRTTK